MKISEQLLERLRSMPEFEDDYRVQKKEARIVRVPVGEWRWMVEYSNIGGHDTMKETVRAEELEVYVDRGGDTNIYIKEDE